jgi:3-oxoacyl-[acyl-carrier-protein] synthase-3
MASVTSREKSAASPPATSASLAPSPHIELPAIDARAADDFGHPRQSLTGVQVLAMGSYAPQEIVRNEDLAALGYDAQWILQRTGITQRRRAAAHEATSDLALAAARDCLAHAQRSADAIDLLIVATMTPDSPIPATACRVAHGLGIRGPAFDINAACAGFMYALTTGMQFIKAGTARTAMIIGADVMSRVSNPQDHKTFPLFGDGAGAMLIGPGDADQGLVSYTVGADGSGADLLAIPAGGSREPHTPESIKARRDCLIMDGRPVFQWAVQVLRDSISSVLAGAQLSPGDVDLVVLHQANMRIIDAAVSRLGIPREKVFVNLDRYGNTSAGSIPLALTEAARAGRIRRGDHIVLSGFGAGLAWGTAVLRY